MLFNRNDIDDDFDPKEIVENNLKEFSYKELYNISKPLDENLYKDHFYKWNKLSVSSFDNVNQIFYDIANSSKAKRIYIKSTILAIIVCFLKILLFSYFLFAIIGTITSKFTFFIFEFSLWKILLITTTPILFVNYFIEYIFKNYVPINYTGKIDKKYSSNKDYPFQPEPHFYPRFSGRSFMINLRFKIFARKPKINSKYQIYKANNGKNYLIDINAEGKYYSIRNWYLISKYIVCNKMSVNDLDANFEDELFVYLSTNKFKKEFKKLKCIFSRKFSLYFLPNLSDWLSITFFVIPIISMIVFFSVWPLI